jgi:hexosaminidase
MSTRLFPATLVLTAACGSTAPEVEAPAAAPALLVVAGSDFVVESLEVRIEASPADLEVRFTLDGAEPTADSLLYLEPLLLMEATTVRARAFREGAPVCEVVERRFEGLDPHPALGASETASLEVGLRVERFPGAWDDLPEFDALTAEAVWIAPAVEPRRAGTDDPHGLRFSGYLQVPASGVYRFDLTGGEANRMRIGGVLVLGDDAAPGPIGVGSVALAAGWHAVEVEWIGADDAALLLRSGAEKGELQPVSPGRLAHR